jgi:hypothetical protein
MTIGLSSVLPLPAVKYQAQWFMMPVSLPFAGIMGSANCGRPTEISAAFTVYRFEIRWSIKLTDGQSRLIKAKTFKENRPLYFSLIDDKKFDSASEGNLYFDLKMQKRQGLITDFECQAKEELWAYGECVFNYYVDFKIIHNDGRIEFIEHKATGTVTDLWKAKWRMLKAKYKNDENVICSMNWYRGYKIIKTKKAA